MRFENETTNDLFDLKEKFELLLDRINYDWHEVAPTIRQSLVLIEQELTRR